MKKIMGAIDAHAGSAVSIAESNMCYVVNVPVPAAKKENIVVYVEDHVATVVVFKENKMADNHTGILAEGFNILFRQKVDLPLDADADFVHAKYEGGVLHMFISKSNKPCDVSFHPVAVY